MDKRSTIFDCHILHLPQIHNRAGNITPIQNGIEIPFDIKRVFYLYDVPSGADRGAHAHKECHQLIIAASGSFDVMVDDGINKKTVQLNRPNNGLHVLPGVWGELTNFSSGAICLVLASHGYDGADYIRDYNEFAAFRQPIL